MDPHVEEDNGRRCGCCCCLKYCIFYLLTFLIWIGGVVLLAIGVYYFMGFQHLQELTGFDLRGIQTVFMWPSIYFIVIGSLRFIACFIGCCGSIKGSTCLLKSFLIVLTVVFVVELIVEISMAVLAFTAQGYIKDYLTGIMTPYIKDYGNDQVNTAAVDTLQSTFDCCGAITYNDWNNNPKFSCDATTPESCGVPMSCCIGTGNDKACGYNTRSQTFPETQRSKIIYTNGCVSTLMEGIQVQKNFLIIGLTLLGIMLVMLFTIIFGFCILSHVRNREGPEGTDVRMDLLKSEREYDA